MMARKRLSLEHLEQVGLVSWWKERYPHLPIISIPNGGKRSISEAKRIRAEGGTAGANDLVCALPYGKTLWIEMKKIKGGKISKEQAEFHAQLESLGHKVIVGYGAEDASRKVLDHFKKMGYE